EPAQAARRLVDEGAIGDLLVVRAHRIAEVAGIWARDGWRTDAERGGGVVLDQVTHFTNLLRTLVGEIVEVHAWTSTRAPGWRAGHGGWEARRRCAICASSPRHTSPPEPELPCRSASHPMSRPEI